MKTRCIQFLILWHCITYSIAQDAISIKRGKTLFNTHCVSCHGFGKEKMGPSLASIPKKRPKEWLQKFIHNSQQVITEGDPYAVYLFNQYNRNVMPAFKQLSDEDINSLLSYITYVSIHPENDEVVIENESKNIPGKALFKDHCSYCHALNKEGYGPALASVTRRRPREWLLPFIKNSTQVIKSGDPYATNLFENFDKRKMISFEMLNDSSIHEILNYLESASKSPVHIAGSNGAKKEEEPTLHVYRSEFNVAKKYKEGSGTFFKLFLISFASLAALLHGYLIYKLYLYLYKNS